MEPTIGIEPMNLFLTKEVLYLLSYVGLSRQQAVYFSPAATPLGTPCAFWWWGEDSNLRRLRRQIYSLLPLAAREPHLYI